MSRWRILTFDGIYGMMRGKECDYKLLFTTCGGAPARGSVSRASCIPRWVIRQINCCLADQPPNAVIQRRADARRRIFARRATKNCCWIRVSLREKILRSASAYAGLPLNDSCRERPHIPVNNIFMDDHEPVGADSISARSPEGL